MTGKSGSHRAHSIIGASGYSRWSRCPGSVRLQRVAESYGFTGSSSYAQEGTAAHEIAAGCCESDDDTWAWIGETITVEGNSFTVDTEMAEAVQVWVDTVRADAEEYRRETGDDPTILVEVSFDLSDIREDMYGTSDIVMLMPKWGMVRVYDYKHGVGIGVDVVRNGQLMYYAVGALHHLGRQGASFETVELVIVQPRNDHYMGPVRRWRTSYDDLAEWLETELIPAVDRTKDPDAPLVEGDHCRFCPARSFCPRLLELAREALKMGDTVKPLTDTELAEWLEKRQALRHFLNAIDDEGYTRLTKGHQVPGYKLVPKRGNRIWKDGAEAELRKALGDKAFSKPALKSPAQVEKLKGGSDITASFAYKPETGLTMVPATDTRPEVKAQQAADVFKDL